MLVKIKSTIFKYILANVVARDVRSVTGKNLILIEKETGLDPWRTSSSEVRDRVPDKTTPEEDLWRLPLLCQYWYKREEAKANLEDTEEITSLINSLCSS